MIPAPTAALPTSASRNTRRRVYRWVSAFVLLSLAASGGVAVARAHQDHAMPTVRVAQEPLDPGTGVSDPQGAWAAIEQRDAADEGRLEQSRSIIVGNEVIVNQGEVVRPSQELIASVGRTRRG